MKSLSMARDVTHESLLLMQPRRVGPPEAVREHPLQAGEAVVVEQQLYDGRRRKSASRPYKRKKSVIGGNKATN